MTNIFFICPLNILNSFYISTNVCIALSLYFMFTYELLYEINSIFIIILILVASECVNMTHNSYNIW